MKEKEELGAAASLTKRPTPTTRTISKGGVGPGIEQQAPREGASNPRSIQSYLQKLQTLDNVTITCNPFLLMLAGHSTTHPSQLTCVIPSETPFAVCSLQIKTTNYIKCVFTKDTAAVFI
jgi:hypothetical protein